MARDDQLAVVEAAFKMSVGRTAIIADIPLAIREPMIGNLVVITKVNAPRSGRWLSYQTVSGIVNGAMMHGLNFHSLWVMLASPDDYSDPDMPSIGGVT